MAKTKTATKPKDPGASGLNNPTPPETGQVPGDIPIGEIPETKAGVDVPESVEFEDNFQDPGIEDGPACLRHAVDILVDVHNQWNEGRDGQFPVEVQMGIRSLKKWLAKVESAELSQASTAKQG